MHCYCSEMFGLEKKKQAILNIKIADFQKYTMHRWKILITWCILYASILDGQWSIK